MAKKARQVTVDAAMKSLIRDFGIPTKKDIDKLHAKIDRLETMLKKATSGSGVKAAGARQKPGPKGASGARRMSATNVVLDTIKRSKKGADIASLQTKTGFDEKKLRNIIFRLHKLGQIQRVQRGVYAAK
ncbi:MAG: hypothetical protein SWH61_15905 [Thermodesulfobacteriota bacterium]|nr:hypothetical protein [Thermodesulfobacteriota bacterium]